MQLNEIAIGGRYLGGCGSVLGVHDIKYESRDKFASRVLYRYLSWEKTEDAPAHLLLATIGEFASWARSRVL